MTMISWLRESVKRAARAPVVAARRHALRALTTGEGRDHTRRIDHALPGTGKGRLGWIWD
jgi:hypothetical protein